MPEAEDPKESSREHQDGAPEEPKEDLPNGDQEYVDEEDGTEEAGDEEVVRDEGGAEDQVDAPAEDKTAEGDGIDTEAPPTEDEENSKPNTEPVEDHALGDEGVADGAEQHEAGNREEAREDKETSGKKRKATATEDDGGDAGADGDGGAAEEAGTDGDDGPTNKKKKQKTEGEDEGRDDADGNGDGTVGSRHEERRAPGTQGGPERLPAVGQRVHWKALPGYVEGEVVAVLHEEAEVEGQRVKGAEGDPRIVLRSAKSGKVCVHKPEAVYFE